jgi:rhodanese-related sulfurtransferase
MRITIFNFLLFALLTSSCSQAQNIKELSVADFEKKMAEGTNKTILDVRTPGEYQSGHIQDAVLIDYYKSDFKQQLSKLDKNKPVFVYCASGGRSGSASDILSDMGFKNIYDLKGGMNAWKKDSKKIVK